MRIIQIGGYGSFFEFTNDPALTESWCLKVGRVYLYWRRRPRIFIDWSR